MIPRIFICMGLMFLQIFTAWVSAQNEPLDQILVEADGFYKSGDWDKALAFFEKALLNDPDHGKALQMAGYLRYSRMDFAEAEAHFKRSVATHGKKEYPLMMLGNIALNDFRPMDARNYYIQAQEISPDSQLIKDNLLLSEENIKRAKQASKLHSRAAILYWGGVGLGCGLLLLILFLELRSIWKQ